MCLVSQHKIHPELGLHNLLPNKRSYFKCVIKSAMSICRLNMVSRSSFPCIMKKGLGSCLSVFKNSSLLTGVH